MNRASILLTSVFLLPLVIFGQSGWNRISPQIQENDIYDITVIPGTERIIAVGGGSTVMLSDDMAETWQLQFNPAGLSNYATFRQVYFFNSNLGFISGFHFDESTGTSVTYILKTTDGGFSWVEITDLVGGGNVLVTDFCFVNSQTGFMLGSGGLYKTSDGGSTWENLDPGNPHGMNAIDFVNDSTGFIVMSVVNQMMKTTNFGNDWTLVDFISPLSDLGLRDIQFVNNTTGFVVHNYGQILKTTNAGLSWELIYETNYISIHNFHFLNENHGVAVGWRIQNMTAIVSTSDGGTTWNEFILPVFTELINSACCIDTSTYLFGGMYGMVYKSTDAGNNWLKLSQREVWGDIYQVQYFDDNTLMCLSSSRLDLPYQSSVLYKSDDGGETFAPIMEFRVVDHDIITPAAFHFFNQERGFLTYYSNDDELILLKTENCGEDWEEIEMGNYDGAPYAIDFYDWKNGLISGEGGFILKTDDGGVSWEEVYNTPYSYYLTDIHYFNENDIIIAGESYWNSALSKLVISHDGGNTWNDMILGYYGIIYDIEVIENTIYLACENNSILKTGDMGNTWQYCQINNTNDIRFHSIHFSTEDIGYAVGDGPFETMMKTTDGGNTWNVISADISSSLNVVHFDDEMNGLAFGQNGVILKTETGGVVSIPEDQIQKTKNFFSVYPNPFNETFTISYNFPSCCQNTKFELYGPDGKLIADYDLLSSRREIKIQLKNPDPGIYMIMLTAEDMQIGTQKLIKLP